MLLEDYFNFLDPSDIRIKGSRIGIESVLYEHIHRCKTPEEIAERFDSITIEQVYATILYYLHNKDAVSQYLTDWIEYGRKMRAEQAKMSTPFLERMRRAKAELAAKQAELASQRDAL